MCVGCVGLVRLLSGFEKYTPSRKGLYLPQVCICKSGSQQMDACREVYRAWMKTHHVACTVYMQQSTPCRVRRQGIYPPQHFSIHIPHIKSRVPTVMVEVKSHFLHYPFLSLYPFTRPQLEFGGGRPLASATSDLLRMILSPKETFSRAIGQRTFGHEMAMLDESCGWRDGVEGVDGVTSFWSFL